MTDGEKRQPAPADPIGSDTETAAAGVTAMPPGHVALPDAAAETGAPQPTTDHDSSQIPATPPVQPEGRRARLTGQPRQKMSQILQAMADDTSRERISISDLVRAMDGRAFGALLLIFAFPNALPAIPGTSGILGLPLLYLAAQMMLGRVPWLPRFIADRSMLRSDFAQLVVRVTPWLAQADRFLVPRLQFLVEPGPERVLGAFCLVLALVLVLPIPLGNMLPAFAICLIALGVLERDGLWIVAGVVVGLLSLVIVSGVVYALVRGAIFLVLNAF